MSIYTYYVYAYIRKSDLTPYYIGKGKGKRFLQKHKGITVPKDRSKIVFLERNLSNVGACALERRYIRWYGKKSDGGILLNLCDGGEGNSSPRTDEWKSNHSNTLKGRPPHPNFIEAMKNRDTSYMQTEEYKSKMSLLNKGKIMSEETKVKISNRKKGRVVSDEVKLKMYKDYIIEDVYFNKTTIKGLKPYCISKGIDIKGLRRTLKTKNFYKGLRIIDIIQTRSPSH